MRQCQNHICPLRSQNQGRHNEGLSRGISDVETRLSLSVLTVNKVSMQSTSRLDNSARPWTWTVLWGLDRAEETVGAGGDTVTRRDFSGTNLGRGSKSSAHRKSGTDSTQWADRQWLNLSLASGQKEMEEWTAEAGSLLEAVGSSGGPDSKLLGWASGGRVGKLRERQDLRDGTVGLS